MKVLFVTSEAAPFAASGGLGDVMGALPQALYDEGIETEVILPLYNTIKEEYRNKMQFVIDISFYLSWRKTGATIYKYVHSNVTYYFVENHYYFDRGAFYGQHDDIERFAFFSKAVIEFILAGGVSVDVLHANDWQSAAAVIYLKTEYSGIESLSGIKTVYTIHNIEYQGKSSIYSLGDVFGIHSRNLGVLEFDGCINLMKGAIVTCDQLTTVSPNYARELKYDYFAFGLAEIIKANEYKLSGVINGIDYGYFSPKDGGDIFCPYDITSYEEGKAKNKTRLQSSLGLEVNPDIPLFSMITRLTATKGIDLLLNIIEELLAERCQVVILGTGEKEYEDALTDLCAHHNNLAVLIKFDRVLSKQIYAASDVFLMPSKSEPCGLAQMIACSYGTVPIVRGVGGLYDTIIPYGERDSNGFRFDNYNAHELLWCAKKAVELYSDKELFNKLRLSCLKSDFTWKNSARKYILIYKKWFD